MKMIQFFALIKKKQGISKQEFHDHWRHPHGTMGKHIPSLREYVQAHQIHTSFLFEDQANFQGIALSKFDNQKDAANFGNDPYYVKYIKPDEPNFVDGEHLQWLNTQEEVIDGRQTEEEGSSYADALWLNVDLPTSVVLLQFIYPDGNPDWAAETDVGFGRDIGSLRHVRNYPSKEIHGDTPQYIGVRQLWWPTLSEFETGIQNNPEAFQQLLGQAGSSFTTLTVAERFLK